MIAFLRRENFDPAKAALRIAKYWKHRHEIFQERWLLPMVQTGHGAMTLKDIAVVRTGYLTLYNAGPKEVLCVADRSKLSAIVKEAEEKGWDFLEMYERCCFYLATVFTDSIGQSCGLTNVQLIHSKERPAVQFCPRIWNVMASAAALGFKRAIVVQAHESGKEQLLDFLRYQSAKILEYNSKIAPDQVYDRSVNQVVRKMEARGIPKEFLPLCVGGHYRLEDNFDAWIRARVSIEELTSRSPTAFDVASHSVQNCLVPSGNSRGIGLLVKRRREEGETELEFRRKRNAVYARRLYHKQKLIILSLQEEIKKYEALNTQKVAENRHLENLLRQAHACVRDLAHSQHSHGFSGQQSTTLFDVILSPVGNASHGTIDDSFRYNTWANEMSLFAGVSPSTPFAVEGYPVDQQGLWQENHDAR